MKAILVLDAETDQALAVVRALSEKKIPVDIAGSRRSGPGFWSLRPRRRLLYPSPLRFPREFLSFITKLLREENYEAVFPATDSTTIVLEKFRRDLPNVPFAMASEESYFRVSDKFLCYDLAQSQGLAVPKTFCPKSQMELEGMIAQLNFPIVLKPRYSRFYDEKTDLVRVGDAQIIYDPQELREKIGKFRQGTSFPCIQEWVTGVGFGVELLLKRGQVLAVFCHERIREMNPLGSGSSACVSVPVREDLVQASVNILKACHYEGVAMVEFRLDKEKERAWFMEINGRFWGSLALPLACGINFPYLFLQAFVRAEPPPTSTTRYPVGIQARSLWKELIRLTMVLRGRPPKWKGPFPSQGEALSDYFGSFFKRNQIYCDFEMTDPLPGIMTTFYVLLTTFFHFLRSLLAAFKGERSV